MKKILSLEDVSRETKEALHEYENLVVKWTKQINLVSDNTLTSFESRHILDSIQLASFVDNAHKEWLDLGSGAGLPGLVIAILAKTEAPECSFELVESDQRKSAFLRTVIRELSLHAKVTTARIEDLKARDADIISARALAPLLKLLTYIDFHLNEDGIALLHKGKNWQSEVEQAKTKWHFDCEVNTSIVDPQSKILKIRNLRHV